MIKNKILVTGGAGFIGSNLCERLAQNLNNDVYSLDNYFMGSKDNHVSNVTYINGSTENISSLVNFKPNIVYHLGEYSRVEQSFKDIRDAWRFNTNGTFAVLEFVRCVGCKILYAGSSTKFGDGGTGRNDSPYAFMKSTNTQLVINYGNWFNMPYAITYFYNVYGKREIQHGKYATLIALFKEKMRNGQPLTVVSPGSQNRNFTHIDDIVDALIMVGENGSGDGYGIGSDMTYSVREVADMFGGRVEMLPARQGNRLNADVLTQKTKALGWTPKKLLKDYIANLKKNNWV